MQGSDDLKKMLEEQKLVSQSLLKQNTSLLLLSAKMSREINQLRSETSALQDSTNNMATKLNNTSATSTTGRRTKTKLPASLTVRAVI